MLGMQYLFKKKYIIIIFIIKAMIKQDVKEYYSLAFKE